LLVPGGHVSGASLSDALYHWSLCVPRGIDYYSLRIRDIFFFFLVFRDRVSLCSPGCPRTQKSACLCLPSAGIKGVRHHRPAIRDILTLHLPWNCSSSLLVPLLFPINCR
jgi:hypothetical protein